MEQEQNPIAGTLAYLKAFRERLDTAIETLEMVQASGGVIPGMTSQATARPSVTGSIDHDAFFQMTVPDAAEKFLTLMKKTKTTADVAKGLLDGGLKSAAKNFPSMLNTVLSRDNRFVRVNREWGLESWYPGMKRGTRRPTEKTPESTKVEKPESNSANAFGADSVRGRTLSFLRTQLSAVDANAVALSAGIANTASVRAALSDLVKAGLVVRAETGRYRAK